MRRENSGSSQVFFVARLGRLGLFGGVRSLRREFFRAAQPLGKKHIRPAARRALLFLPSSLPRNRLILAGRPSPLARVNKTPV